MYRRRLEPLFEEETESDEEKTQQESEELKKGETTTNGHYLEDSVAGSSSEEEEEEEEDEEDLVNTADYDEEDEDQTSTEERLQPNLPTTSLGPRPLSNPLIGSPLLPASVLKASSCEYLLDQHIPPTKMRSPEKLMAPITMAVVTIPQITNSTNDIAMTMSSQTKMTTSCSLMASTTVRTTTQNLVLSSAFTTTSSESVTIESAKDVCSSPMAEKNVTKTLPRPAKFIPPPPPPRRLLLTQTNLKTTGPDPKTLKTSQPQRKSGAFADDGCLVGAIGDDVCDVNVSTHHMANTDVPPSTTMKTKTKAMQNQQAAGDVCNIKKYSAAIGYKPATVSHSTKQRQSSTIIETSLLGSGDSSSKIVHHSTSSTIASTTKKEITTKMMTPLPSKVAKEKKEQDLPMTEEEKDSKSVCVLQGGVGSGLSPRLEMRLALNHDILGDEDLISYEPGPDLTTILGHDLSTFQRLTGRDLLNRSTTNRVQPKEAVISFSQQRNSKMDTPTVNRRPRPQLSTTSNSNNPSNQSPQATGSSMPFVGSARVGGVPQHLQPNRNTWSSSVSVARNRDENASDASNSKNINYNKDDNKLSDLEILARREKIYCMSQLKSGSLAKMTTTTKNNNFYNNPLTRTTSTTSMAGVTDDATQTPKMAQRQRKIGRDETALMEAGKANKLINFIKRRNSENPSSANNSQTSLNDSNASSTPQHKQIAMSPRKDNDKPSLNRRLWKQITKRRRSNSVSELVAS